ncbi:hypothetical protein [Methylorubrum populi]|uniref:hypothetical protein n=1 Tax=Methylorubrum populi TaxID=223967 RepID=UPI001042805F|nr:hypothetical protein [Methylorubrum populi]
MLSIEVYFQYYGDRPKTFHRSGCAGDIFARTNFRRQMLAQMIARRIGGGTLSRDLHRQADASCIDRHLE